MSVREFSLPNIEMLVDVAPGLSAFSFIDGFSGYNQVKMDHSESEKNAC